MRKLPIWKCLVFAAMIPNVAITQDISRNPAVVHNTHVMYYQNAVELDMEYLLNNPYHAGVVDYFLRSCKWLKKHSDSDYCRVSSDGQLVYKIIKNNRSNQ